MAARTLQALLGLWLVGAGLLLAGPDDPARIADVAAGVALVLVALLAAPGGRDGSAAIALGAWVMLAPSALAYPSARGAVVDVLTGVAIVALALRPAPGARRAARG